MLSGVTAIRLSALRSRSPWTSGGTRPWSPKSGLAWRLERSTSRSYEHNTYDAPHQCRDLRSTIHAEALTFYGTLGFTLVYGGPQARFSTLQAGHAFVNLTLSPSYLPAWWGRIIFRVDDVDALYQTVLAAGCTPTPLQMGAWGERYFHLTDPMGTS